MLADNFDRRDPLAATTCRSARRCRGVRGGGPNDAGHMGTLSPDRDKGKERKGCLDAAPRCAILKMRRERLGYGLQDLKCAKAHPTRPRGGG
jgi:hypothetical protein